jgi:hypothetical protein
MKAKYFLYYLLTIVLTGFFSCENEEIDQRIRAQDYYGDGSYFISLARLSSPDIQDDFCGNPLMYEIRNDNNLGAFGTASVYIDGLYLNIQYDLLGSVINQGWGIVASLVWIGKSEDWDYGKKGPVGGWSAVPDIIIERFSNRPASGVHQILLEEWMFDDCFVLAIRLAIEDPDINRLAPKAFINHGEYITYAFNDPFCLEKCNDPGTHNVEYWENNPNAWPFGVSIGEIFYSEELAIQIMQGIESSDDMTEILFEQLAGAKLNVAIGNSSYCIAETIEVADTWMEEYGPAGSTINDTHPAWNEGAILANFLENYNNGFLCVDAAN